MSRLEDICDADEDSNDLDRVIENDNVESERENSDEENDGNDHSEAEEEKPRVVDPPGVKKPKQIRNPYAVLNPRRLTGPRGIQTIEAFFKDFKFLGKGHEKEDLDLVMKKLEHWAHRLFPKFQFDDCIDKIASLGNKKEICVNIRKIRMGMMTDDQPIVEQVDSEDEERESAPQAPVLDEFDLLLDQQIALARSTPASTSKAMAHHNSAMQKSTDLFFSANSVSGNNSSINVSTPTRVNHTATTSSPQVSEEQKVRIMKNRLIAEERRLARMKQNAEKEKEAASERDEAAHIDSTQSNSEVKYHQETQVPSSQEHVESDSQTEEQMDVEYST